MSDVSDRRRFIAVLGQTGIALGVCGIASAAQAKDKPSNEDIDKEIEALKIEIESLSAKLDSKVFKIRKSATEKLIAMGKPEMKDGKDQNEQARKLILAKMKILVKDKDPEVKTRAKQITIALCPPPIVENPRDNRPALGGVMMAPQQ